MWVVIESTDFPNYTVSVQLKKLSAFSVLANSDPAQDSLNIQIMCLCYNQVTIEKGLTPF